MMHFLTRPGCAAFLLAIPSLSAAQAPDAAGPVAGPVAHVYKATPQGELRLYLFRPAADSTPPPPPGIPRRAIVFLHGGGWAVGEPAWTFGSARHFASLGLVGVGVQYRLSDQRTVSPIDAMEDARDAIRWLRRNAGELRIDPDHIAAHGYSAGAHLAAAAALIDGPEPDSPSARPNALILSSPAVAVSTDGWFRRLVGSRGDVETLSPDMRIERGAPPALVLVGEKDTVTPLAGAERFCARMRGAGSACELHVYPGVGHLFTRNLDPRAQEEGPFDTDPRFSADARVRTERFLRSLGYLPPD